MDELKIFENPAFGKIRALTIEREPWFVGRDVCVTFGDTTPSRSLGRVDEQDKMRYVIQTAGGNQEATLINESGLYSLLFSMQPEKANKGGAHTVPPSVQERIDKLHAFKRWVTSEVLPSIRKTGGYIAGQEAMTDAELMAAALMVADRQLKERNARIAALESKIQADAPKVRYAEAVADSEGGMLVREFAKFLQKNGVETGEKRLFADLRRRGLIIKAEGRDKNKPTQYAMERGWFTVKEVAIDMPLGVTITKTTPLITGKGRQHLLNVYLSEQAQTAIPVGAEP